MAKANGVVVEYIRWYVREFIGHAGHPVDLDRDLIPYIEKDKKQPVVRGYLLQTLVQKGRGFTVRFNGERCTVDYREELVDETRRPRRPTFKRRNRRRK